MAAGGSQVPATGDIGHWNTIVDEVRRCLIPETPVDGYGKLPWKDYCLLHRRNLRRYERYPYPRFLD